MAACSLASVLYTCISMCDAVVESERRCMSYVLEVIGHSGSQPFLFMTSGVGWGGECDLPMDPRSIDAISL